MEFLRTAAVVNTETIGTGINRAQKVALEKNGIRADGILRTVDVTREHYELEGRMYMVFRDSYRFECAAYNLAELLDLDNIPPAVLRDIRGKHGSLQIWMEDLLDEEAEDFSPPNEEAWAQQLWDMHFFDNLIANVDRNSGNSLVDSGYKLWLIDHTRAFQSISELIEPETMPRVNRRLWTRLLELSEEDVRSAVSGYLAQDQIAALMTRRDLLIDYVNKLIAERGEDAVLY
jgi:hypothetical protein